MKSLVNRIPVLYLCILLLGTVIPLGKGNTVLSDNYTLHIRWDYLLHALVYLPMPGLMWMWLREKDRLRRSGSNQGSRSGNNPHVTTGDHLGSGPGKILALAVMVSLVFTVLFEGLQLLIPYRAFNINDMVANGVGVVIGLAVVLLFRKTKLGYLK